MSFFRPLAIIALLSVSAVAQVGPLTPAEPSEEAQDALQSLFDPQLDGNGFSAALKAASDSNIPQQVILEAQVIRHVFREPSTENAAASLAMLSSLLDLDEGYDPGISPVFDSADEARAVVSYGNAVAAYEKGNIETMKKDITEAFWLHPEQAAVFGQLVTKYKTRLRMESLEVELERPITDYEGNETTLKKQIGDNKALLLDFWASWCGPCIQLMPALKEKAEYLKDFDVVVAGMNTDQQDGLSHAKRLREEQGFTTPWLCDSRLAPLQADLEIDSIPRMVLISPEGKILFNGHPEDPELWTALRKVAGNLKPVE